MRRIVFGPCMDLLRLRKGKRTVGGKSMNKKEAADRIEKLSEELLHQWCESLLKLQIKGTGNPRLDGGILCPACGMIHGRCMDAVYPFMRMAKEAADRNDGKESRRWIQASRDLFKWADYAVQQENGVYWNDIGSAWTGTTVFLRWQMLCGSTEIF